MSEKYEVKRSGAKAQWNSGRGKFEKGDAVVGPFNYDIKEFAKSFTLSRNVWLKAALDAVRSGRGNQPALQVILGSGADTIRLWVIDADMFKEMLEAWEEKYE